MYKIRKIKFEIKKIYRKKYINNNEYNITKRITKIKFNNKS